MAVGDAAIVAVAAGVTVGVAVGAGVGDAVGDEQAVASALALRDGRTLPAITRRADAEGRFELAPGDLPARSMWRLSDVAHIGVTLPTLGGHEMVAEASVASEPCSAAFLPLAVR